tara:strand:- start:3753 stop:4841 length:1089 start_codon:yes stop_codon:yes gene_type:complete
MSKKDLPTDDRPDGDSSENNVISLYNRSEIKDEASLWVVRLDRELDQAEVEELRLWLLRSELHRDTLFDLAALWDDLCVLNQLSSLFPFDPAGLKTGHGIRPNRLAALAASVVLCVGLGIWFLADQQEDVGTTGSIATMIQQHSTVVGENRLVRLSDGSSVHLNTNSRIRVSYTAEQRVIELKKGEARFSVAKDSERPFIVEAGESSVRALGTVFNVDFSKAVVEVLVTEGKVLVTHAELPVAEQVTILPGQWTRIDHDGVTAALNLPLEVVQKELAWRDGMLIFRGESLADAVLEIGRYTDIPLTVADEQAGQLKIAGFFKAGDVDGLLNSLTENFPVTYTKADGGIIIAYADLEAVAPSK